MAVVDLLESQRNALSDILDAMGIALWEIVEILKVFIRDGQEYCMELFCPRYA
jgi:hypothetical protein